MRTKTLRTVAVTLGLGVCTVAQAQNSYTSPSKWNNFRTVSDTTQVVPTPEASLPAPSASDATITAPTPAAAPVGTGTAPAAASPYSEAMSAPWPGSTSPSLAAGACGPACGPTRPPLSPWFGAANLLFYTLETDRGSALAYDGTNATNIWSSAVDPDASVGFDVMAGRYFCCGQYGFGLGYMLWDPSAESITYSGIGAGTLRANRVEYNDLTVDAGAGADNAYQIIDGNAGAYAGAVAMRVNRDLRFQGIEANLFCFGLMGARRAAYADCNPCRKGFGGAAGPLVRACNGRLRAMTSHGFRWLRIDDDFETAYNVDGNPRLYS